MIDKLQNAASVKPNLFFSSIKKLIHEYHQIFIHALFSQPIISKSSKQLTVQATDTKSENGSPRFAKITKALPNSLIFTNGKNLSID